MMNARAVHLQVVSLGESCVFCWIGDERAELSNLSVVSSSPFATNPVGSCLLGGSVNDAGHPIANRLALACPKMRQIFVSCNLPEENVAGHALAEKKLKEILSL